MTNSPALIVRHARFTPAIAMLLAALLAIAAVGVSVELYQAQAGVALVLAPQVLVLLAAYLVKTAGDRWRHSSVRLAVSAEGLALPGVTVRPVPWTAVTSVRAACCSPVPEHAMTARHYLFLTVEAPESFGVRPRTALQRFAAPLPADAPPISLDITELDASKEAILAAVHRFLPNTQPEAAVAPAAWANDASIHLPSVAELRLAASHVGAEAAALAARRREVWPAALALCRSWAWHAKVEGLALIAAAGTIQRGVTADARRKLSSLRDHVAAIAARTHQSVQTVTLVIRQGLKRT